MKLLTFRQTAFALAAAGVMLLACPQSKADTVYTSRSAFNAATAGVTTINFDGYADASNNYDYPLGGLPLDIGAAEFTISGPGAIVTNQNQYVPVTAYPDGAFLFPNYGSPDQIYATFPASTAVGFNVGGAFGDPSSITITLSDGHIEVLTGLSGDSAQAGTLGFIGFASATPITSVSIVFQPATVNGTQFGALDNFSYGTSVTPEPSSFALLGSGLAVAAGAFRRKIFRK